MSVWESRAEEGLAAQQVGKVTALFDKVDASRIFDISAHDGVQELILLKRSINIQLARAKRFPAVLQQFTPFAESVSNWSTSSMTEHYNTILRQLIKRIGVPHAGLSLQKLS